MNELHTFFVLLLILFVIGLQIYFVLQTSEQIELYKNIFPSLGSLKMIKVIIPEHTLKENISHKVLQHMYAYEDYNELIDWDVESSNEYCSVYRRSCGRVIKEKDYEIFENAGWTKSLKDAKKKDNWVEVTLIDSQHYNSVYNTIIFSINTYLLRNKGAVSDFYLVKDIVDRNTDALDDEINSSLPSPLYLGLMGTMFGIIISVGWMTLSGDFKSLIDPDPTQSADYTAINVLLSGVGLAMISSFTGLFFTMWNSTNKYKSAKNICERSKNQFFTFIQTELLPVLSQNAASSIDKFEKNLTHFNKSFAENNEKFFDVLEHLNYSFQGHAELIKEIKSIDLKSLTIFNAKVLKELKENTVQFEKFNGYIALVNELIENADSLNHKLNLQLDRTQSIEEVAEKLNSNTLYNKELMEFIWGNFNEIKERTAVFNSAVTMSDEALNKSVEELRGNITRAITSLKNHTEDSLAQINDIQVEQLVSVKNNKNLFDNLNILKSIDGGLRQLAKSMKTQETLLFRMNENLSSFAGKTEAIYKPINFWEKAEKYAKRTFFAFGSLVAIGFVIKQIISLIMKIF